jgi:hypothetical protein
VKGHELFRNYYYLVDNLCASMLSELEAGGQEQNGGAADPVPIWECVKGDIEMETCSGFVVPTFY